MKDISLFYRCRFIAGIVLLSCLESCLSIGEHKTVLERREIGKEDVGLDFKTYPPEIDGDFILVGIEQKLLTSIKPKSKFPEKLKEIRKGKFAEVRKLNISIGKEIENINASTIISIR